MRTGCADASKLRIGPTPLLPLRHADQKASLPRPLGATTPRPLTTTLRKAFPHESPAPSGDKSRAPVPRAPRYGATPCGGGETTAHIPTILPFLNYPFSDREATGGLSEITRFSATIAKKVKVVR